MSTGKDAANPAVYGEFSHSFVLDRNQIIEIVVNNHGEFEAYEVRCISNILQIRASILSIFMVTHFKQLHDHMKMRAILTPQMPRRPHIQPRQCEETHLFSSLPATSFSDFKPIIQVFGSSIAILNGM